MARFELVPEIPLRTAVGPKGDGLLNSVRYFYQLMLSCIYRAETKSSRLIRIFSRETRNHFGRIKSQLGGTSYVRITPDGPYLPIEHPISRIRSGTYFAR